MNQDQIATLLVLGTPFVAVIGAVAVAILRLKGQQRLAELVQRERLAAIERGLDLSQLALPVPSAAPRARGLLVGGVVTIALGLGLALTLVLLPDPEAKTAWPIGLVPFFVGVALVIAARITRES